LIFFLKNKKTKIKGAIYRLKFTVATRVIDIRVSCAGRAKVENYPSGT